MRELKFRAWDKQTRKMSPEFVLFGEFTLIGGVHAWQDEEAVLAGLKWDMSDKQDSLLRLNDLEVMQYTGLTDVAGKEIYEGDILTPTSKREVTGSLINGRVPNNDKVFVSFSEGAFKISSKPKKTRYSLTGLMIRTKGYEVIGNIYEHGNNL